MRQVDVSVQGVCLYMNVHVGEYICVCIPTQAHVYMYMCRYTCLFLNNIDSANSYNAVAMCRMHSNHIPSVAKT
jgi:hypothetical protein